MATFQRHVFVCVNSRAASDPKGSCGARGADAVAEAFKVRIHEHHLKRLVRPNRAYCLDQCAQGVVVVVYPEAVWYGNVTVADVEEIVQRHVIGGEVVERLRIPPERLTGIGPEVKTIQAAARGE